MKIVFMGTPYFAAYQLEQILAAGIEVAGVVTMPDKPMGRGMQLGTSAVKEVALKHNLPVLQPEKLRDEEFLEALRALSADVFVVVAFRMLPKLVWAMPPKGTLNLHASLLPQYRGAAPINWVIINGETETGVTTFFIQEEIDTGDIIRRDKVSIEPADTAGTLHDKLMSTGADTIIKTLGEIEAGTVKPVPQGEFREEELKAAPKIFKDDCKINWELGTAAVSNLIRGMSPYPAAWTRLTLNDGRTLSLKVFSAEKGSSSPGPGKVVSDGKKTLEIGTADGSLLIKDLQLEGKKRMETQSFLIGFDLSTLVSVG